MDKSLPTHTEETLPPELLPTHPEVPDNDSNGTSQPVGALLYDATQLHAAMHLESINEHIPDASSQAEGEQILEQAHNNSTNS